MSPRLKTYIRGRSTSAGTELPEAIWGEIRMKGAKEMATPFHFTEEAMRESTTSLIKYTVNHQRGPRCIVQCKLWTQDFGDESLKTSHHTLILTNPFSRQTIRKRRKEVVQPMGEGSTTGSGSGEDNIIQGEGVEEEENAMTDGIVVGSEKGSDKEEEAEL